MLLQHAVDLAKLKSEFQHHFPYEREYVDIAHDGNSFTIVNTYRGQDYTETTYTTYKFCNVLKQYIFVEIESSKSHKIR